MAQKVLTAAVLCETHKILMTGLSAESGGRKEAMTAGAFRPKGVLCVANGGEKVYYDPIRIEGGVKSLCENTEAYLGDKLLLSYQVVSDQLTLIMGFDFFLLSTKLTGSGLCHDVFSRDTSFRRRQWSIGPPARQLCAVPPRLSDRRGAALS